MAQERKEGLNLSKKKKEKKGRYGFRIVQMEGGIRRY